MGNDISMEAGNRGVMEGLEERKEQDIFLIGDNVCVYDVLFLSIFLSKYQTPLLTATGAT
jgi:hypothetical protein